MNETEEYIFEDEMMSSAEEINREMRQKKSCDFCQETFREVELSDCKIDSGEKVSLCECCMSELEDLQTEYLAENIK